ncbi:hypothetical protein MSAN_02424100 [Mycena sanguinolenta]|uniref:TOG domain-containing protein n=1 Tax=Mycena sanguinolenta TaxID=230812 RepID=A0A8H6X327_9AGAR|nr:hypothetical protein MSAN_02424100 [Mycena sanguinolenta]
MASNVYDDNTKPAKDPVVRSQATEKVQSSTDLWSLYLEEANERAKAKVDLWNGSLGAFLLFAGLFAGVVSSFVIDSRARLQPSSSANSSASKVSISTLAINFLWFTSLTFTLISALAAVLAQTWIVKFSLVPTQGFKGAKERWIRDDKAEHWHLHTAIAWITVLIQLSLFLFLAGFAVQAVSDHKSLGWTILSFVGATFVLYIGITVLPWFYPTTPFRTPFSELSRRNQNMFILEAPSLDPATTSRHRIRDVRKFIQSFRRNVGKTPDDAEARLGICWSILKNSSNNASIYAAVRELIKNRIMSEQSLKLIDLGLPEELSTRLAHLPAGQENVERMKDYLHVIMWMVDDCKSDVAQRFSLLVKSDGALLLTLDALPLACRALAFAIRVNLLVNTTEHGKIHGTDWAAMIEGLEPDLVSDVFRTAIRGLGIARDGVKADSSHIRQDCARLLAAYIGSARFPNEKLAKSRIPGDPLRIPRTQQESIGHIKTFFSQLEEAWKRSMCARAIRLMGDIRLDRQVMGFKVLSSVAENETFQDAVTNVLPDLANTLETVDWKTSVDCLGKLSEILKHDSGGKFRGAIQGIFPQIVGLLSDSGEEVRNAVLGLGDQMGMKDWVIGEIKRILADLLTDLSSSHRFIRLERLDSLAELIKTDEVRTAIIGQEQSITGCISFRDAAVRLAAIRTLQELAKDVRFRDGINNKMPDILGLVSDADSDVRAAAIDFVSEISKQGSFHPAINRNILEFMTDSSESERWFARRDRLEALGKIIDSEHSYAGGIESVLSEMHKWLSDPDEAVRQAALEVVSIAADKARKACILKTSSNVENAPQGSLEKTMSEIIPIVSRALDSSSRTQIAALSTLSALAHTGNITAAIPKIVELFKAEGDVMVSALKTCAAIAKIQPASLHPAVHSITAEILPVLNSSSGWETQVAALDTLSTLAETNDLCEAMNDNALDMIFACLTDDDSDVRAQVLKTLAVLATKMRFHNKIKTAIGDMLPLLEDWSPTFAGWDFPVRRQALDTFTVFANHGIFVSSNHEVISHLISMLSEGNTETTTRLLVILSTAAEADAGSLQPGQVQRSLSTRTTATTRELSAVTDSLRHQDWRVRVAGLKVLESLANDAKYNKVSFLAQETIAQCLSDAVEEVKVAGLRTLFKFVDKEIFEDRRNVPDTVPEIISSFLRSESEDVRISAIQIITTYATNDVFYPVINGVIPTIVQLLDRPDEDSHVAMLETICDLADTGKFTTDVPFVKAIRRIFPSLLSNQPTAVRMAALQILPIISGHDVFDEVVADTLEPLLKVVLRKEDVAGNVEEADDAFRIDVLKTLSDLAQNETLGGKIHTRLSKSYALAAKGSWPVRVAFLKLMSVLGTSAKDPLKRMVKQMIPDLSDALHDNENDEVRMAGVQLLSISVVEDISSKDFNSLLTTLVTLLFDREEDVRTTALQTLSDLAKQDAFREAINGVLPAILEALDQIETNTRVAALETCAALAQDIAFREIINRAAPQIIACVKDADDEVRVAAMVSLSQLSREEAFWIIVHEAAPHVMSQLESARWNIRLQALQTLSIFAENDAFGDTMNSFLPRILECMEDEDDDVRVEVLKMLLNLVQQNFYQASILGSFQASGLTPLIHMTSDGFRRARMAALPLIPKVIELGGDAFHDTAGIIMAAVIKVLSNDDEECLVALETLRTLVEEDVAYATALSPEILKLLAILKPDDLKSRIPTAVLLTLTALVTQDKESVNQVVAAVSTLFTVIKDTEEPQFWDATAKVFVALASLGSDPNDNVHKFVSSCVTSALDDSNRHSQHVSLTVDVGITAFEVDDCRQITLEWVDLPDLDVRLSAIRVAASLNALETRDRDKLHVATQKTWRELTDITNSSEVGLEKLNKIADHVDVFIKVQFTDVIPPITAALKDQSDEIALSCLRAISRMASEYKFRATLVQVVPKITALLSNRKSDPSTRVGVLQYLLELANYPQFRVKIQEQVSEIIPVLKDRDSNVRAAGLQVLSKLVEEVPPENLSDRIKSTIPTLLTLIQNSTTRENSVALITCLAADKTLRSELLTKLLPITLTSSSSRSPISWGQLLLIARLLEHKRLKLEESDLRFISSLITSRNTEVQDFVLKFMTNTLQQYLETWIKAEKFPPSLLSAFSSVALLKR